MTSEEFRDEAIRHTVTLMRKVAERCDNDSEKLRDVVGAMKINADVALALIDRLSLASDGTEASSVPKSLIDALELAAGTHAH